MITKSLTPQWHVVTEGQASHRLERGVGYGGSSWRGGRVAARWADGWRLAGRTGGGSLGGRVAAGGADRWRLAGRTGHGRGEGWPGFEARAGGGWRAESAGLGGASGWGLVGPKA